MTAFHYHYLCFAIFIGGGEIIPQVGTISGDACTGLSPLSEGVTLDLEVSNRNDLFQ